MSKGGYIVIDCKGGNIGGSGITVPGAYNKVAQSKGKPLLLSNVSFFGRERIGIFCQVCYNAGKYYLMMYNVDGTGAVERLLVAPNDNISRSNIT